MTGFGLIAAERIRQIADEGWTAEHDDGHTRGELAIAAESYLLAARHIELGLPDRSTWDIGYTHWPWDADSWKPSADPIRNLVKAGALIAAEIDRLQRNAKQS